MNKIEAMSNLRSFADEVDKYRTFTVGEGAVYRNFYKTAGALIGESSLEGDFLLETSAWVVDLKMVLPNGKNLELIHVFMDTFDLNGVHHLEIEIYRDLEKLKFTIATYNLLLS